MIYVDGSVALAHLPYEVWNRIHGRRRDRSLGDAASESQNFFRSCRSPRTFVETGGPRKRTIVSALAVSA